MSKTEIDNDTKGLRIATAHEVWRDGPRGANFVDPGHIYGRIERGLPHVVLNKYPANRYYINDFSNLPKRLKKDIIGDFANCSVAERRVLYIVDSQFNPNNGGRRNRTPRNN